MRTLVVNGDDFGLTPGVNAGILDAHASGVLSSASLFANAPATEAAIDLVRRTPTLGVGVHLSLVDGTPVLGPAVPTLAPGGRFRPTWASFIMDAVRGRIGHGEIERELTAQVERLVRSGLSLTHLDSHKHVHAYPPVFATVARLARRFGVAAVRIPLETPPLTLLRRYVRTPGALRQAIENLALVPWAGRDRAWLERHEFAPAPRFHGRVLTGLFTPATFQALVASVPDGVNELMVHPGYPDAALDRMRTRLRRERGTEVSLLTAGATFDALARAGVTLVRHDHTLFIPERLPHASGTGS